MARSADSPPVEPDSTMSAQSGDSEGFLTRWSRRKQAARDGALAVGEPGTPASAPQAEQAEAAAAPPRELTDEDMPPVESLDEHSDYSAFLSPKVSEELRQVALRKLFKLPDFNTRDGLDDYDEDYTSFSELGGTVTHDMRRMLEREKEGLLAAEAEPRQSEVRDSQVEAPADKPAYRTGDGDSQAVAEADAEAAATPDQTGGKTV